MSCIFFIVLRILMKWKPKILLMLNKNVCFLLINLFLVSGPTLGCYYSSMGLNRELND